MSGSIWPCVRFFSPTRPNAFSFRPHRLPRSLQLVHGKSNLSNSHCGISARSIRSCTLILHCRHCPHFLVPVRPNLLLPAIGVKLRRVLELRLNLNRVNTGFVCSSHALVHQTPFLWLMAETHFRHGICPPLLTERNNSQVVDDKQIVNTKVPASSGVGRKMGGV